MSKQYCDTVIKLECNIDDMSGEWFGYLMKLLFAAGAVDVWFTPLYGKKGRPLYMLSVLVGIKDEKKIAYTILKHSSTAGIRREICERIVMDRSFVSVKIASMAINVKRLTYEDIVKYSPEWDDCVTVSEAIGRPVSEIYAEALTLALSGENEY